MNKFSQDRLFHFTALLLLALAVGISYSNTLQSPFIFDDFINIVENPAIKYGDLSLSSLTNIFEYSPNKWRWLPNVSFALNYYLDGFNVLGFHLTNIFIHLANAFVFYLLARLILNLPRLQKTIHHGGEIALAAALLWAVHPLQTNAVTYIVQRMTSMASLFFLLSLLFYLKARLQENIGRKTIFFLLTALFGVMALFSKENSGMLPIMILGLEFFFLQKPPLSSADRNRKLALLAGAVLLFIFVCWLFLGSNPFTSILGGYARRDFTPLERVLTETRIVLHYLTLLVLPLPSRLNLAYDFPLSTGLVNPLQTLPALICIGMLAGLIFLLRKRAPLVAFGIFWLLGNLLVESSVIALELLFEHRMYLPSMFVILAAAAWGYKLCRRRIVVFRTIIISCVIILSFFTWQRNVTWKDEITLWTDVATKAPNSLRGNANLGTAYYSAKKYAIAEQFLLYALEVNEKSGNFAPRSIDNYLASVHNSLAMVYRELQKYPQAIKEAKRAMELATTDLEPLVTLGITYTKLGDHQTAYGYFKRAAAGGIQSVDLYNNWAISSFNLGLVDESITMLKKAIQLEPNHVESHYNLGIAYSSKGMLQEAQQEMALASKLRSEAAGKE